MDEYQAQSAGEMPVEYCSSQATLQYTGKQRAGNRYRKKILVKLEHP